MSEPQDLSVDPSAAPVSTREVRILEGPNLYFPRPAVKVTLDVRGLVHADKETLRGVAGRLGARRGQPGAPGSGQRQRVVVRLVERAVRAQARACGTARLGVRARITNEVDLIVVAFVWRRRGRGEALGQSLTGLLTEVLAGADLARAAEERAAGILAVPDGAPARLVTPKVPVASITGTNGKTTTTRLLAHIGMTAGLRTAWSSTDGVLAQGELIEEGDYSGPAGARTVLATPGVQLGILETARGGMLLKGLGVTHNDVSVVTNVSADHLGQQGIDTVDQLAEVKAIVTKVTRPKGWVVLNGDDPRVWAMRAGLRAKPWVFSLDGNSPAVREALGAGGRAITVIDDAVTVLTPEGVPDRLVKVVDLPMTLSGLSQHNVANALAGAAAALALGIAREAVVEGLRTFQPDARLNPGRMNTYTIATDAGRVTVIVDLAHNEAGLDALLDVARGLVAPGGRVHLGLGTAGDRSDEILEALGEIAGRRADHVVAAHKSRYLRGRTMEDLESHLRVGLGRVGVADIDSHASELEALQALVAGAADGDVVAIMSHGERAEIAGWLQDVGASADDARTIRRKVVRARGEHEVEDEIAALWADDDAERRIATGQALYAAHPGDPRIAYEYAGTYDSAGRALEAVALYEEALDARLVEPYRHRARFQLASTLRNLGRLTESVAMLEALHDEQPDNTAITAMWAMAMHDAGRSTQALGVVLGALLAHTGEPDVERYRRSLTEYARTLGT